MNCELETHTDTLYVLPAIIVAEGGCECCGDLAGWIVSVSWLFFSLNIYIPSGGRRE